MLLRQYCASRLKTQDGNGDRSLFFTIRNFVVDFEDFIAFPGYGERKEKKEKKVSSARPPPPDHRETKK